MGVVNSVVDLVRQRAEADPGGVAYTFLEAGEREGASVTWGALERHSRAIGAAIAASLAPASRVLIVLPPCVDFGAAFLGVLYAGATAIPTYPPSNSPTDRTTARIRGIIADAGVSLVVSCSSVHARREQIESLVPELSGNSVAGDRSAGLVRRRGLGGSLLWRRFARGPSIHVGIDCRTSRCDGHSCKPAPQPCAHCPPRAIHEREHRRLVATGEPRHGVDQRRPAGCLQRFADDSNGAGCVPAAPGAVAPGDLALRRHAQRRTEFRLRLVRATRVRAGSRRSRSEHVATRVQRLRAGSAIVDGGLHANASVRTASAGRPSAQATGSPNQHSSSPAIRPERHPYSDRPAEARIPS